MKIVLEAPKIFQIEDSRICYFILDLQFTMHRVNS